MNTKTKAQFIKEILDSHNKLRTNPSYFIEFLQKELKYFKGNVIERPGVTAGYETVEGPSAVKECIEFLKKQKKLSPLEYNELISKAAQDHASDIGPKGELSHTGSDGSSSGDRIDRYLAWEDGCCENIDFGSECGDDVIYSLCVDDGVSDRGHRKNLFNPDMKYMGVGIDVHPDYERTIVINYVVNIPQEAKSKNEVKEVKEDSKKGVSLGVTASAKVGGASSLVNKMNKVSLKEDKFDEDYLEKNAVAIDVEEEITKLKKGDEVKITTTYTLENGSKHVIVKTEMR